LGEEAGDEEGDDDSDETFLFLGGDAIEEDDTEADVKDDVSSHSSSVFRVGTDCSS
jgi:hypothetical protein